MLKNLIDNMTFFESENGYDKKVLPADIDNNFKLLANKIDERVGKDFVDDSIGTLAKVEINAIKTIDDTQTDLINIILKPKCTANIKIIGTALQDDYATEWVFNRELAIVIDDSGSVTIDADNNTDVVKDDTDWAFDVTATNDSANPYITLKVTGKASTNIIWYAKVETNGVYFK